MSRTWRILFCHVMWLGSVNITMETVLWNFLVDILSLVSKYDNHGDKWNLLQSKLKNWKCCTTLLLLQSNTYQMCQETNHKLSWEQESTWSNWCSLATGWLVAEVFEFAADRHTKIWRMIPSHYESCDMSKHESEEIFFLLQQEFILLFILIRNIFHILQTDHIIAYILNINNHFSHTHKPVVQHLFA